MKRSAVYLASEGRAMLEGVVAEMRRNQFPPGIVASLERRVEASKSPKLDYV